MLYFFFFNTALAADLFSPPCTQCCIVPGHASVDVHHITYNIKITDLYYPSKMLTLVNERQLL